MKVSRRKGSARNTVKRRRRNGRKRKPSVLAGKGQSHQGGVSEAVLREGLRGLQKLSGRWEGQG